MQLQSQWMSLLRGAHYCMLITFFSFVLVAGEAEAKIPLYAEDWGVAVFPSNTEPGDNEVARLIMEYGQLYAEDSWRNGDSAFFAGHFPTITYLSMNGLRYAGPNSLISSGQDIMAVEEIFYHSTDPSSLVGWRNEKGNEIHLKWGWDYRYYDSARGLDPYDARIRNYVVEKKNLLTRRVTQIAINDMNWFDDVDVKPDVEYSYRILSVANDSIRSFTPVDLPFVVTVDLKPEVNFWDNRVMLQEGYYGLDEHNDIDWVVSFGCSCDPSRGNLKLQVVKEYLPDTDPDTVILEDGFPISDYTYDSTTQTVTFVVPWDLDRFKRYGGLVHRLEYTDTLGAVHYFPAPREMPHHPGVTRPHFLWSTVNNRVMGCTWFNYKMNLEGLYGGNNPWLDSYVAMAEELCVSGVHAPDHPEYCIVFDGLFMDSAIGRFSRVHNVIRPFEYFDAEHYYLANLYFIQEVNDRVDAKLYPNTTNMRLVEDIRSIALENVQGFMYENPVTRSQDMRYHLAKVLWLNNQYSSDVDTTSFKWDNFVSNSFDFNFADEREKASDVRMQALVFYLLAKRSGEDDTLLFGYGKWTPFFNDANSAPNFFDRLNIMPEQLIDIGSPLDNWEINCGPAANLPDAENFFDWIEAVVPGLIHSPSGSTRKFAVRLLELNTGIEEDEGQVIVVMDWGEAGESAMLSLNDLLGGRLSKDVYYRLHLENDIALVTEGAHLWTEEVEASQRWEIDTSQPAIFFTHPISSPEVASVAEMPLPIGENVAPVLKIAASHWNGVPLDTLRVDCGALAGWDAETLLTYSEEEGLYVSEPGPDLSGEARVEYLPYVAVGSDGLRRYGSIEVSLIKLPVLSNKSAQTGELNDLGNRAWAATTLNIGADLNSADPQAERFGAEDLVVTIQEHSDPGVDDSVRLFKNNSLPTCDVPDFTRNGNLFDGDQQPGPNFRGVAVADFDNDGYEDLLMTHGFPDKTRLYWWDNDTGLFKDALLEGKATVEGGFPGGNYATVWGDYNQDGYVDLFMVKCPIEIDSDLVQLDNPDSVIIAPNIYEGAPHGDGISFTLAEPGVLPVDVTTRTSLSLHWVDIDGDADLDIIFTSFRGDGMCILINSGYPDYVYSDETAAWLQGNVMGVVGSTLADLDNDGLPDLVLSSLINKNLIILKNMGPSAGFVEISPEDNFGIEDPVIPSMGDVDLNGYVDIVTAPFVGTGAPGILLNGIRGNSFEFQHHPDEADWAAVERQSVVLHDWGSDGDLDLYLPHDPALSGGEQYFFYMNGQSEENSQPQQTKLLRVCVIGSTSGGVGAKVSVRDSESGPVHTAWVRQSEGRGGESSRILVFAIPEDTDNAVSGTVTWPNGDETTYSWAVDGQTKYIAQDLPVPLVASCRAFRNIGVGWAELEFSCTAAYPLADFKVDLVMPGG